jgi:hypothetical protein
MITELDVVEKLRVLRERDGPGGGNIEDLLDVRTSIEFIRQTVDTVTPGRAEKQLNKLSKHLEAAQIEFDNLPYQLQWQVFRGAPDLMAASERAGRLADEVGSGPGRAAAGQKKRAALEAYMLMSDLIARKPTATNEGAYVELADLLYEAATGIAGESCLRQCRESLRELFNALDDVRDDVWNRPEPQTNA